MDTYTLYMTDSSGVTRQVYSSIKLSHVEREMRKRVIEAIEQGDTISIKHGVVDITRKAGNRHVYHIGHVIAFKREPVKMDMESGAIVEVA